MYPILDNFLVVFINLLVAILTKDREYLQSARFLLKVFLCFDSIRANGTNKKNWLCASRAVSRPQLAEILTNGPTSFL